jgi:deazaflavin-dependent oxidoreductase (nitroreductase family)
VDARFPKIVTYENALMKMLTRAGIKTGPVCMLTVVGRKSGQPRSTPVTPFTVEDTRYILAGLTTSDWARNARVAGRGTLQSGRQVTPVALTEVIEPGLKRRLVTAFGTGNRMGGSFLVRIGVAADTTREGVAAATDEVAVFEVTPTAARPD